MALYVFLCLTGTGLLDRFGQPIGNDFIEFYVAGRLLNEGRGADIYPTQGAIVSLAVTEIQTGVLGPAGAEVGLPYVRPPFYAALFAPLSRLPFLPAYLVWTLANMALLLLTLLLMTPVVPLLQGRDRHIAWVVACGFSPVIECFIDGQSSVISLLLLALATVGIVQKRDGITGLALGVSVFKPQLVMLLPFYLLYKRRYRAVAIAAGTAIILGGISVALVGWDGIARYVSLSGMLGDLAFLPGFRVWNQHSLYSFFVLLLRDQVLSRVATAALSMAALVMLAQALRKSSDVAVQISLVVLATALVNPYLFVYDLAILVLPGLLLASWVATRSPGESTAAVTVLLALAYLAPLPSRLVAMGLGVQISVIVFGLLFGCLACVVVREGSTDTRRI